MMVRPEMEREDPLLAWHHSFCLQASQILNCWQWDHHCMAEPPEFRMIRFVFSNTEALSPYF